MKTKVKMITKEDVEKAFENTNFGGADHFELLKEGVLKRASGWACGSTLNYIMCELGLITPKRKMLTRSGRMHLWEWHTKGDNP